MLPARQQESRGYSLRHLVSHLAGLGDRTRLFELIEQRGFFAEQAKLFGGFGPSSSDLEIHALPAAIEAAKWDRFLHYALIALNLRSVAESLADPDILHALSRGGKVALAKDAVDRISEPLRRAEARAALAASTREDDTSFQQLLSGIGDDLEAASPAPGTETAQRQVDTLCAIAYHLGSELESCWPEWISRWAAEPHQGARVWRSVADGWLRRGPADAPGLWQALMAAGNLDELLGFVPARLGDLEAGDPAEVLRRLRSLFGPDSPQSWQAAAIFLNRRSKRDLDSTVKLWEAVSEDRTVPWSAELIDAGRELFGRLPPHRIENLVASIADPVACAALRSVALEQQRDTGRAAAALSAISGIQKPESRLYWSLRYLAARPSDPRQEVRRQVAAVVGYLNELRYAAAPEDLALFLDLVAKYLGEELPYQVENVVWAPACRPESLRSLVEKAQEEAVLDNLFENAERYAATVAPTAAEGFQLRGELLARLACRLCILRKDLTCFDRAQKRLLPEEEDELRSTLALALSTVDLSRERRMALVKEVCEGIRDRRRKLLTCLESLPSEAQPQDLLEPGSLYASLASSDSIEDERLALSALLESPLLLHSLAERYVRRIHDRERQNQALIHLAWHALAFESSFFRNRQDRVAAIELVRGSISIGNDVRLVALTPEIAALGAQVGGARRMTELQEAARRLMTLDTVSWPLRFTALERLLSYSAAILSVLGADHPRPLDRRAVDLLQTIARFPIDLEPESIRKEVQEHWHEVLPLLVALGDRLPAKAAHTLDKTFRAGLSKARPSLVFTLCLTLPGERYSRFLAEESPDSETLAVLSYLLAAPAPERVPEALRHLPPGLARDQLCLRLIRNRWLPMETAAEVLGVLDDPDLQCEARLWLDLSRRGSPTQIWLRDLAGLVVRRGIDPSDPAQEMLLRHVWDLDPEQSLAPLARATVQALAAGGRKRGDASLRLWLHAYLVPRLGSPQADRLRESSVAQAAIARALVLSPLGSISRTSEIEKGSIRNTRPFSVA